MRDLEGLRIPLVVAGALGLPLSSFAAREAASKFGEGDIKGGIGNATIAVVEAVGSGLFLYMASRGSTTELTPGQDVIIPASPLQEVQQDIESPALEMSSPLELEAHQ